METDCQSVCQESQDVVSDTTGDEEAEVVHQPPVLHVLDLPDSVIFQILMYLPFSSVGAVAQVCSRFSRISSDELLWRHVFIQHYKLAANTVMPSKAKSWRQEFKRLYYHTPAVLSEERKEHKDEVLHVSFSHDGTMFATCSKDGFFKVWECTHPVRLLFKMDMKSTFSWKFTQFSQFNETDTCLLVSGVYFGRLSTSGEIAVFNLQDDFRMQCRVTNKPYDVFGAWYDNDHLLSGTLYWTGDFNSVSAVWLSKASQEVESEVESVSMVLYRFENVNSSSIRLLHVAEIDRDSDASESVPDKEDFDGTESAQTSPHGSSLGFGDEVKVSTDADAADVRPDVKVKDQGHVDMEVERPCILDLLLQKYIAEDEFDLENEDKTDNEGEGDEFRTKPDGVNQISGLGPPLVENPGNSAVPLVAACSLDSASIDGDTDGIHSVETDVSYISFPTSSPEDAGDLSGGLLKDYFEPCLLNTSATTDFEPCLLNTSATTDFEPCLLNISATTDFEPCLLNTSATTDFEPCLLNTSATTDFEPCLLNISATTDFEPCLLNTSATTDSDMELDVTRISVAYTQVEDEIFPEVRSCECRSRLRSRGKHDVALTSADTPGTNIVESHTSLFSSPTLPFLSQQVSGSSSPGIHHPFPLSAASTDNPSAWSSNAAGNDTKSSTPELESKSHGCDCSSAENSQFPSLGYLDTRTGLSPQDATTDETCIVGNLRGFKVSTESNVDFLPDHSMEVIMDVADLEDVLPPCMIRAMPDIFSAADDALAVGSSTDVHEDAGATSGECLSHSLQMPLLRDRTQQGTDFEEALDNRNEDAGVAFALEDALGAKDASQQFGNVSPQIVPSLFDNNNLVMLIPGASHVYGSRHCDHTNSNNSASCYIPGVDLETNTFEPGTSNIDVLVKEPGHNHKSSIATQTEVASSRASSFHSLSHISQSSSLSRDLRFNPPREKLLIYTWGSETYIPHKVGIKRMKWTDFTKGEVTARRSSMLLPDVMENLHNMAGNRRDKPDVTIEMHGHIVGLSLSPDHKFLYVNCRPWPKNYIISDPQESPPLAQEVEISTIDLTSFNFVGPVLRSHKAYTHSDECFFLNLDVSDDYVASGAEDRQGYLWDRYYGIPLYRFPHRNVVNCVAINPQDSEILVTVSDDYTFKVWMSRCRAAELTGSKETDTGTSV